jgi:hypothetical protein
MRLLAPSVFLIAIGLAACSPPSPSGPSPAAWQKPGTDRPTIDGDTAACRAAAQAEALRQYPYRAGIPAGAGGMVATQQHDDTNRATVEAVQFNDCMTARGYRRG